MKAYGLMDSTSHLITSGTMEKVGKFVVLSESMQKTVFKR